MDFYLGHVHGSCTTDGDPEGPVILPTPKGRGKEKATVPARVPSLLLIIMFLRIDITGQWNTDI